MKKILKRLLNKRGFSIYRSQNYSPIEKPLSQQKIKTLQVGNFRLFANETHPIENHLKQFKEYSLNLPRIAMNLHSEWSDFNILDIGANIGDTVALFRTEGIKNTIYCVEPVKEYFNLLEKNTQQFSNVTLFNIWLDESERKESCYVKIESGTASINKISNNNTLIETITLDQLIKDQGLQNIKLLKIDTDGFDFKILRGGLNSIREQKPVLFFEYDEVYLSENNDDGWETLATLRDDLDYDQALYFDNYGRFLCSFSLKNERQAKQLLRYISGHNGAFPYFDICLFHSTNSDLAERIILEEEKRI